MEEATQCPFCREQLMRVPVIASPHHEQGRRYIRRGLLYMLMASVARYYLGGYSPQKFPFMVIPEVTQYLVPLLFLLGFGLLVFGVYRRFLS
jgi:hypothetical protein